MQLGSKAEDFLFDYERGFLVVDDQTKHDTPAPIYDEEVTDEEIGDQPVSPVPKPRGNELQLLPAMSGEKKR